MVLRRTCISESFVDRVNNILWRISQTKISISFQVSDFTIGEPYKKKNGKTPSRR